MDRLWTPWRYQYVTNAETARRAGVPAELDQWPGETGCVFCNMLGAVDYGVAHGMDAEAAEAAAGILLRGEHCFVVLNAYPYSSGHVMVLPYVHVDRLNKLTEEASQELMQLARRTETALEVTYRPHGMNFGLNLGQAAGAGVAHHLHLHALPRWVGDTNFMTTVAEARVVPESLDVTWKRLRAALR